MRLCKHIDLALFSDFCGGKTQIYIFKCGEKGSQRGVLSVSLFAFFAATTVCD